MCSSNTVTCHNHSHFPCLRPWMNQWKPHHWASQALSPNEVLANMKKEKPVWKMACICGGVKKTLGSMLIYRNHVYACLCPFLSELQSLTWISSTLFQVQVFFSYTKIVFLCYPCDLFPFLLLWERRYFQLEFNNVVFNHASARHAPLCTHQLKGQFDLWWIGILQLHICVLEGTYIGGFIANLISDELEYNSYIYVSWTGHI